MEPESAGERLDRFLARVGAGPSRSFIQKAIAGGHCLVNNVPAKAARILSPGDEIEFIPPPPQESDLEPEAIPLQILYEDRDLIVLDKPRGMVVHPGPGNPRGTLVHALLAHCRDLSGIGGRLRPGIVHRLDKDTTGLLVVAKNDQAHLNLSAQLKERTMSRVYLALVHGHMPDQHGLLALPIGRHPVDRKRMAIVAGGREALTEYRVIETLDQYQLLRLSLSTGRTHQIRVHLAAVGHPVVGDRVYAGGRANMGLQGQALHAAALSLVHPRTGERLHFTAPPPSDFLAVLAALRAKSGYDPAAPVLI